MDSTGLKAKICDIAVTHDLHACHQGTSCHYSAPGLFISLAKGSAGWGLQMSALLMQEYAENRSITSVVPVDNPLTTDEPELLQMSPEQAEDTQLCVSRWLHSAHAPVCPSCGGMDI